MNQFAYAIAPIQMPMTTHSGHDCCDEMSHGYDSTMNMQHNQKVHKHSVGKPCLVCGDDCQCANAQCHFTTHVLQLNAQFSYDFFPMVSNSIVATVSPLASADIYREKRPPKTL